MAEVTRKGIGRRTGTRRRVAAALAVAVTAAVLLGGLATVLALHGGGSPLTALAGLALTAVTVGAVWLAFVAMRDHFGDLRRFEEDLSVATAAGRRAVRWRRGEGADELGALVRAVDRSLRRWAGGTGDADRVAAILGGVDGGIVAFTGAGMITVVNPSAARLLGDRAKVGHSVFAIADRDEVRSALAGADDRVLAVRLADRAGRPCAARLVHLGDGGLLCFDADAAHDPGPAAIDLSLHDRAPPPVALTDDLPLVDLPVLSLDVETTGLDPASDRLLSIGALRVDGDRLYEAGTLDLLLDPGMAIPRRSIRVHGIDDAMVAGAPAVTAVWDEVRAAIEGTVVLGHQIGFDLAVLGAEARRHGLPPLAGPAICTMRAYSVAFGEPPTDLDRVAARLGVDVIGRHTALGDAIVTAEIWRRLLPALMEHGIERWGQLRELAAPDPWGTG